MNERDELDEFTGYRLDGKAKPLSRNTLRIRALVGLLALIIGAITHKEVLASIALGLRHLFEGLVAAF
jgi:hypothetical protein